MKEPKTIREAIESVFMMGLGVAGADDIAPEEKDKAILNTQKYAVETALQDISRIIETEVQARFDTSIVKLEEEGAKRRLNMYESNLKSNLKKALGE